MLGCLHHQSGTFEHLRRNRRTWGTKENDRGHGSMKSSITWLRGTSDMTIVPKGTSINSKSYLNHRYGKALYCMVTMESLRFAYENAEAQYHQRDIREKINVYHLRFHNASFLLSPYLQSDCSKRFNNKCAVYKLIYFLLSYIPLSIWRWKLFSPPWQNAWWTLN